MNSMLLEEIIGVLSEQLKINFDDISIDSLITDELRADSLDIIELVDIFEKKYSISASDEDIMGLSTVESIYNYIAEKLGYNQNDKNLTDGQLNF